VTRQFAGVFGRTSRDAHEGLSRALGERARRLTAGALRVAEIGPPRTESTRTLLLSGDLRNARALAVELGLSGAASVDDVLAAAFARWGEAALGRLRGGFTLVVWDGETQTGLIATDQLGVGALYLHESAGSLSFATELRALVRLVDRRPAPAAAAVAQWLSDGYLERGETLWEGVRRLEGGRLLRLEHERWVESAYWSPTYREPERMGAEAATEQLRAALGAAVRDRLAPTGTTGVLLSGGLDSSTVAAFARDSRRGAVRAYTHLYPDHPEMDESSMVAMTAEALGIEWEGLPVRVVGTLPRALEFQLAWEVPAATPMLAFTQPLLERIAAGGVSVVLDGEGGDELFGLSPYLVADRLRRLRLRGALALLHRLPDAGPRPSRRELALLLGELGLKGAAPHGVHRAMRRLRGAKRYAAPWLTEPAARLYVETRDDSAWKRLPGPRWWAYLAHLVTHWREQMGAYDFMRQRDSEAGLETRHPLLDDLDLVELVLRLPPELSFDAELTRPLERALTAGVLPDEIRARPDKSTFGTLVVDAVSGPDWPLATRLLRARDAELWAYARPEPIGRLLEVPPERRSIKWARLVWRLATTESWLRAQADPGYPSRLLEGAGPR
jgi:asparagine synthase (glutamine-hydrolysing)